MERNSTEEGQGYGELGLFVAKDGRRYAPHYLASEARVPCERVDGREVVLGEAERGHLVFFLGNMVGLDDGVKHWEAVLRVQGSRVGVFEDSSDLSSFGNEKINHKLYI